MSLLPVIANIGLPLIALHLPWAVLLFLPIVLVETAVASRVLKTTFRDLLLPIVGANAVSTGIGVPVAWFVMVLLGQLAGQPGLHTPWMLFNTVALRSAWLWPHFESDFSWLVPLTSLVLLVPYYFASVLSEFFVLLRVRTTLPRSRLFNAVRHANQASYFCLLIFLTCKAFNGFR